MMDNDPIATDPDAIRTEIAATRERLSEAAAALAYKTDVQARARDVVNGAKLRLGETLVGASDVVLANVDQARDAVARTRGKSFATDAIAFLTRDPRGIAVSSFVLGIVATALVRGGRTCDDADPGAATIRARDARLAREADAERNKAERALFADADFLSKQ